ncbi:transmembrane protein 243-like [Portunus trituberculatus]|uniref:Transmembrane protein 243 n=1 Tax=Portunus trituberculatus TaxID=210409 RepID=A0A5B7CIF3_PORTR|nr:transmembrane protein 243-like [Portunus trituberculatus]XP_045117420.1 transmembrane protein 243-like [Portunus trituberculatus]XP_045117421.1 transmembrane protein 243-like [Portunus trituberculatus]XP_045117422.1 transmembrane protein 243-like [Portunus trituberculatus]XP_045117423.1 transmembrane protein 243-like [Portunus trituberculatus]MPC09279.1 Transmembrane protein 243 [Portunus trituberculatus]
MSSRPGEGEYEPLADRPLFGNGEARPRDRMVNIVIVCVTVLLVFITTISAFVSGSAILDLFFVVCIILFCISHLTLIVWYRHGDLDPKFKKLIYFNTLCIILTCICGNIFFHT